MQDLPNSVREIWLELRGDIIFSGHLCPLGPVPFVACPEKLPQLKEQEAKGQSLPAGLFHVE